MGHGAHTYFMPLGSFPLCPPCGFCHKEMDLILTKFGSSALHRLPFKCQTPWYFLHPMRGCYSLLPDVFSFMFLVKTGIYLELFFCFWFFLVFCFVLFCFLQVWVLGLLSYFVLYTVGFFFPLLAHEHVTVSPGFEKAAFAPLNCYCLFAPSQLSSLVWMVFQILYSVPSIPVFTTLVAPQS